MKVKPDPEQLRANFLREIERGRAAGDSLSGEHVDPILGALERALARYFEDAGEFPPASAGCDASPFLIALFGEENLGPREPRVLIHLGRPPAWKPNRRDPCADIVEWCAYSTAEAVEGGRYLRTRAEAWVFALDLPLAQ